MDGQQVYANGISGLTGQYLIAPTDVADVAALAKGEKRDSGETALLESVALKANEPTYGLPWNIDPTDVAQAGWGVVFAAGEDGSTIEAVEPLIEHRRRQLGAENVKVLDYRQDESWADWLVRHGTGPANVDPYKVPYYILLVGSPGRIPFAFQYLLDVEYAVGRIHFDDRTGYLNYVTSLIDYEETTVPPHDKSAAFFGSRHPFDPATQLSADRMVRPLALGDAATGRDPLADRWGYETITRLAEKATWCELEAILAGSGDAGRPALLFTATHGMGGWPPGHPAQPTTHGALLCQDWPGIGIIDASHYFAAQNVPTGARLHGLVAFFFACYGAGTPQRDEFTHVAGTSPAEIAHEPFLAALPKTLLSHPNGGALAAIGHIERAWGYSFMSGTNTQLIPFENALGQILVGRPIGHAMKDFNEKYAVLSANLSTVLREIGFGSVVSDHELARLWTERNDAQNYILIGDPAARLKHQQ